jgi:hypothetical protein
VPSPLARPYALFTSSEIHLAAPASPLAFTMNLCGFGSQTQHKFLLIGKTNLSPAQETLKIQLM